MHINITHSAILGRSRMMATAFAPILGYKYNVHSAPRFAEENPNELKVELCLFGQEGSPTQQENLIGLCVFWIQKVGPLGPPFVTGDGVVWMNFLYSELACVVDLLRNEKPAYIETNTLSDGTLGYAAISTKRPEDDKLVAGHVEIAVAKVKLARA
jgi:hypothetical protein